MTKWKQPSNGITALIVPSGDSSTTFIEQCCRSSVASLSDRSVSFLTDDKSHSIAMLNWSSRPCLGACHAISSARRSKSAPSQAATPVTTSRCAKASSAPTQVPEGDSHSFWVILRFTTSAHQACWHAYIFNSAEVIASSSVPVDRLLKFQILSRVQTFKNKFKFGLFFFSNIILLFFVLPGLL